MTIFVDEIHHYEHCRLKYKDWCHMWSDNSLHELWAMGKKIGLKWDWHQVSHGIPHFDLVPSKREQAIQAGAQEGSMRRIFEERRKRQQ